MTLGVIDVGTNAVHLLVSAAGAGGRDHIRLHRHALVFLGAGGLARRRLTAAARRRALAVLAQYAALLRRWSVDRVAAVATSAVRDAANGRAFVRQVRARTGLPLRIISGQAEARLIDLGVRHLNRFRGPTVVIAIGGGSAGVTVGSGRRCRYAVSVPLGGARLGERFLRHDPPWPSELAALRAAVRRGWAPTVRALRRCRWRRAVAASASLGQVLIAATGRRPPRAVTPAGLRRLVARLEHSTARQRRRLPGLDPRRQHLLLPTAVALLVWMEACAVPRVRCAPGSLREGLVAASRSPESPCHWVGRGVDYGTPVKVFPPWKG